MCCLSNVVNNEKKAKEIRLSLCDKVSLDRPYDVGRFAQCVCVQAIGPCWSGRSDETFTSKERVAVVGVVGVVCSSSWKKT